MAKVRSARSPISANSQSLCGFNGERLRPFCELASTLPVCRQRPTQAVAVDSSIPNRRPAPRAENHSWEPWNRKISNLPNRKPL